MRSFRLSHLAPFVSRNPMSIGPPTASGKRSTLRWKNARMKLITPLLSVNESSSPSASGM